MIYLYYCAKRGFVQCIWIISHETSIYGSIQKLNNDKNLERSENFPIKNKLKITYFLVMMLVLSPGWLLEQAS